MRADELAQPEFEPGVLEITVHKASELQNLDKFSKSDPYVKVRYGNDEFKSQTIQNNLEPESGKIQLSATFSKVVLEDSSTEKPIIEAAESESNLEKAEKIVSDIVEKAEKVLTECEAQLETDKEETNIEEQVAPVVSQEKFNTDSSFKEISKGSQEVIDNIEKTMNEEIKVPYKKDSFDEIEKESKDIVDKLQTTLKSSDATDIKRVSGFMKFIIFEAENLQKTDLMGKS